MIVSKKRQNKKRTRQYKNRITKDIEDYKILRDKKAGYSNKDLREKYMLSRRNLWKILY